MKLRALACLLALSGPVVAEECLVHDAELRGRYRGECRAGFAHGEGVAEGEAAEYRGAFLEGRKHGMGTKTWRATGDSYTGDFVADRREGHGVYRWGPGSPWSGERYEGEYRDDKRHGTGRYVWSSGDAYVGPWENDEQKGPQTPMQRQRTRASRSALAELGKPGGHVCGSAPLGIDRRVPVEGEVMAVVQDRLLIKVLALDGKPAEREVLFWDIVLRWRPCKRFSAATP